MSDVGARQLPGIERYMYAFIASVVAAGSAFLIAERELVPPAGTYTSQQARYDVVYLVAVGCGVGAFIAVLLLLARARKKWLREHGPAEARVVRDAGRR